MASDKDFDIDEVLKEAVNEDEKQNELEQAQAKIEAQTKEIENLKKAKESDKEKQEQKGEESKKEKSSEEITIENLAEEVSKISQNNEQEAIRRVDSGMIKLTGALPDLMKDQEVLDSPALKGTPVTVKQYLEGVLSLGNYEDALEAAKDIMRAKEIKIPKISETLPRGTNVGGESEEENETLNKKKKNVNDLLKLMYTGKLASKVAKARTAQT